ncbi:MAG TPA: hydroxyacid dehydrogenase [Candidatus Hydrogenedentes bacterium]|nr:hydroxyacid dehydrogenase [Candidatus Hydrogenedentota bacterium]
MKKPRAAALIDRTMEAQCFTAEALERIAAVTEFRRATFDAMTAERLTTAIRGAQIAITGWGTGAITDVMLDAAPDLKLVAHAAGSIKHLVSDKLMARNVRVCSAVWANGRSVAEFAFGMMLVTTKAVWKCRAAMPEKLWPQDEARVWMREPFGATVGIVGAGVIGREMIRLCQMLELAALLIYDPYLTEEEAEDLGVVQVGLDELMRRSDVVSLHTPATEEARHIINAGNLALLKDGAVFINTARGMCVDEDALIAELESGRITACLDVTNPEPPAKDSPLYTLPNCILTPHIAGSMNQNCLRHGDLVADAIEAYVAGRPLPWEVDLTQLDRMA